MTEGREEETHYRDTGMREKEEKENKIQPNGIL